MIVAIILYEVLYISLCLCSKLKYQSQLFIVRTGLFQIYFLPMNFPPLRRGKNEMCGNQRSTLQGCPGVGDLIGQSQYVTGLNDSPFLSSALDSASFSLSSKSLHFQDIPRGLLSSLE